MTAPYTDRYYERQVSGALRSAQAVVPLIATVLRPTSVADFGCGRGAWLRAWREAGVEDITGFDGTYVSVERLQFPAERFRPVDLSAAATIERTYEFAQSLEVAEHLPESSSVQFVGLLTSAAPIVLFSAAVPGQGGESHINEQPLEAWRTRFAAHGYLAFDYLRPLLRAADEVEPWYRYNSILYVRQDRVGSLPPSVARTAVPIDRPIDELGSLSWRMRRAVVGMLPRVAVDKIARALTRAAARRASERTGKARA